ncbi:UPF0688 protein C1orf174 homolog isoform X2 [Hemicordylus capensis]|uniref:UPF0688 protein C1orf174 homolog isoform X2 n=1 Tax=Hemicordylus capensis TaxID=884348 RepID=UPI002303AB85|nr:UPF0688 protein C1orf174 homolog isoform X2 [Hemicordylus capensis]
MRARRGPPRKGTGTKRPPKKLKRGKRSRAKLEIQGPGVCGSSSSAVSFPKEPADTTAEGTRCFARPPSLEIMLQSEGKGFPKRNEDTHGDQADLCVELPGADGCFPKADSKALFQPRVQDVEEEEEEEEEEEDEEEICGAEFSDSSEMEPEELQGHVVELDNSAFLNEDSNQPLPMDRFFGSVAFMQDLPAAPLARATASRREFRKLHFIAKDDDDEDADDDVI